MELIGEIFVKFFIDLLIRFPVGLFKIWMEEGRKKSLISIIRENEFDYICLQGTVSFINIIAAIGALAMFAFVVGVIVSIFRNGFTR
ncbi:MAG TPA: hypothetical protein DGG95_00190 [Cytophagales bacterium]|jgi:hypothetical protein|nr:hypothetical protein [Cytophagales bacterium]